MWTGRILRQAAIPSRSEIVHGAKSGIKSINLNLSNKGMAQVAIAVKAGTRHEASDNAAHTLANCKGNASESHTEHLQIQMLERAGVDYEHKVTRDHIIYTMKCGPRLMSEMFSDVVLPGLFCSQDWHWEIREKEHYMTKQLEHASKEDKQLDLLHACSFKGSLARTVQPAAHRLGQGWYRRSEIHADTGFYWPIPQLYDTRISPEEVKLHRDMHFVHDNITIFTSGMTELEAQAISDAVAAYTAKGGERIASDSSFVAGESRIPSANSPSGFIGFPGASIGSESAAAYEILAKITGGVSKNYEGAGLFAIPHTGNGSDVVKALSNISDDDINNAKEICANQHAFDNDNFEGAVENMLNNTFNVDFSAVQNAAVKNLAASLVKGPKSMVTEGRLEGADFLADL